MGEVYPLDQPATTYRGHVHSPKYTMMIDIKVRGKDIAPIILGQYDSKSECDRLAEEIDTDPAMMYQRNKLLHDDKNNRVSVHCHADEPYPEEDV